MSGAIHSIGIDGFAAVADLEPGPDGNPIELFEPAR